MSARALFFAAPGRVEVRDVDLPDLEDGKLLVETEYSGISAGTELLAFRGLLDPSLALDETLDAYAGTFAYPFRYGYAAVGRVARSGAPAVPAGARVFAFHPHQDRLVVDAADAIVLPDDLDARTATLYPLVETALQVTLDAAPRLGEKVVVLGLGAVGLLTSLLLARTGADVVASEPGGARRDAAAALGVKALAPAELAHEVRARTGGRGADLVVEASGAPDALGPALDLLAHEGTAVVCSWYGTTPVTLPLGGAFHRRRLRIESTQVSTIPGRLSPRWTRERRRDVALRLLVELPLAALATRTFPFEAAQQAYEAVDRAEAGLIHAALRYGAGA